MEFVSGLYDDGTVLAKGWSSDGSEGRRSQFETLQDLSSRSFAAAAKAVGTHVMQLKVGDRHALALMQNGDVYSSGDNQFGQLCRDQRNLLLDDKVKKVQLPGMTVGERVLFFGVGNGNSVLYTNKNRFIVAGWPKEKNEDTACYTMGVCRDFDVHMLPLDAGETVIGMAVGAQFAHLLTSKSRLFGWGMNLAGALGPRCKPQGLLNSASTSAKNTHEGCWTPFHISMPALRTGERFAELQMMAAGAIILRTNLGALFGIGQHYFDSSTDYDRFAIPFNLNSTAKIPLRTGEIVTRLGGSTSTLSSVLACWRGEQFVHLFGFDGAQAPSKCFNKCSFDGGTHMVGTYSPAVRHPLSDFDLRPGERIVHVNMGYSVLTSHMRVFSWGSNNHGITGTGLPPGFDKGVLTRLAYLDQTDFMPTQFVDTTSDRTFTGLMGHTRPRMRVLEYQSSTASSAVTRMSPDAKHITVELDTVYASGVHARCLFRQDPPYDLVRGSVSIQQRLRESNVPFNITVVSCPRPPSLVPGIGYVKVAVDPTGGDFKEFDAAHSAPMQTQHQKRFIVPFCAERYDSDRSVPAKQGKFCVACKPGYVGLELAGGYSNQCEICPPGMRSTSATKCTPCPVGHYCSAADRALPCSNGNRCPHAKMVEPERCPVGSVTNNATSCRLCPSGFYCPTPEIVVPCELGMHCGRRGLLKPLACKSGHYCPNGVEQIACPTHGLGVSHECAGGVLKISDGFWKAGVGNVTARTSFYQCPSTSSCVTPISSSRVQCREGSHGPLCALCETGYAPSADKSCEKCDTVEKSRGIVAVFVIACIAVLLLVSTYVDLFAGGTGKNLVTFLHGMSAFAAFSVPWHSVLQGMMDVLGPLANLEMRSIAPMHCLGYDFSFYDAWAVSLATPLLAMLIVAVYTVLSRTFGYLLSAPDGGVSLAVLLKKRFVFIMWLVYPGTSGMILQFFNCESVAGVWYLKRDYSIECYDKKWYALLPIAVLSIAAYIVATPIVFVRLQQSKNKHTLQVARLLSLPYKAEWYFTEQLVMVFKALLWVFAVFLSNVCLSQMLVVSFCCVAGFVFTIQARPFLHNMQNKLMGVVMCAFSVLALFGLVLQTTDAQSVCSKDDEDMLGALSTAVAIVAVIVLGCATMYLMWKLWLRHLLSKPQIMISYKHSDSEFAQKLVRSFERCGFNCWIDTAIRAGSDWRDDIATAIRDSAVVIFLTTPAAVGSKYCKEELYFARSCGKAIFPVMLEDTFTHLRGGVKVILQRIQWVDFTSTKGYDTQFKTLVTRVREEVKRQRSADAAEHVANGAAQRRPSKLPSKKVAVVEGAGNSPTHDIFLCHSLLDTAVAAQASGALGAAGLSVAVMEHAGGDVADDGALLPLFDKHDKLLRNSSALLVVVSEHFPLDDMCKEILHAAHELDKQIGVLCTDEAYYRKLLSSAESGSVGLILASYKSVVTYRLSSDIVESEAKNQDRRMLVWAFQGLLNSSADGQLRKRSFNQDQQQGVVETAELDEALAQVATTNTKHMA